MRRFFRNTKGAVTVFVSLLMIPAILISGTAVDIARMHTARSSVQNANQLAANAALAQYNALLNDIYGLFGIIEDYPVLGGMLIEYINVSVFGGEDQDRGLGTLQPLYGSNLQAPHVSFAPHQNLGNPEVLRQQILEYTALRAPYIILEDIKILDIIDSFQRLLADATAIDTKLSIGESFEELVELYEKIYNRINDVNSYIYDVNNLTPQINPILVSIRAQIDLLHTTRDRWTSAHDSGNTYLMNDLRRKYNGILGNIEALTIGGRIYSGWVEGYLRTSFRYRADIVDGETVQVREYYDEWISGRWSSNNNNPRGLNAVISELRNALNNLDNALTDLINLSIDADVKRQTIESKIDLLYQTQLPAASAALRMGMTEPKPDSVMCNFKALVQLDGLTFEEMANAVAGPNGAIITQVLDALDNMGFGHVSGLTISEPMVSLNELEHLRIKNIFPISFVVDNRGVNAPDRLGSIVAVTYFRYNLNLNLQLYQEVGPQHMEFFMELHNLFSDPNNENENKTAARDTAFEMLRTVREAFGRVTNLAPGGQSGFFGPGPYPDNVESVFDEEWENHSQARQSARNALNPSGGFMSMVGNIAGRQADRLLLITYGTRMFSNFTTCSHGGDKTMSRVSMNDEVNFFFQSEQEYLFTGNLRSAALNIAAVSGLIWIARFVMNYISTFIIKEINGILNGMKKGGPKFAIASEVIRVLWAMGESFSDVISLLLGNEVTVFKTKFNQWNLGLGAGVFVAETMAAFIARTTDPMAADFYNLNSYVLTDKIKLAGGPGVSMNLDLLEMEIKFNLKMNYDQHLWLLLLLTPTDTLTRRIGHLISLNVTHYKGGGPEAANINFLREAHTGFAITTAVDMRMLFLGLPMAQNFASEQGITAPSTTLTVTARDYRGY